MPTDAAEADTIPIDAYCVALDETSHYFIDKADAPFIKAIRGVYLFDRNCRTFCCEMTPSYYLIHLYDQVECQPGTSEDRAQQIYDAYENHGGEDCYVHCHTIEGIIKAGDSPRACHLGTPAYRTKSGPIPYDEMNRDEQMESLRESYVGNPPL